jgi:hypothetical protein
VKNACSRYEDAGTDSSTEARRLGRYASINFQFDRSTRLRDSICSAFDLGELTLDERLASKTRIDSHDQNQIDEIQYVIQGINRGAWIERNTGVLSEAANVLKGPMHMRARFRMHGQIICAGVRKCFEIDIDWRNHQVHVERFGCMGLERPHDLRANGNVGHKMTIHYIDVDKVGACPFNRLDLCAQPREIRGEQRRSNAWTLPRHPALSAGFDWSLQGKEARLHSGNCQHEGGNPHES